MYLRLAMCQLETTSTGRPGDFEVCKYTVIFGALSELLKTLIREIRAGSENISNRFVQLTVRPAQGMQGLEVGLIMDGTWIKIEILDTILQHALPMACQFLEGRPHAGLQVPTGHHQLVPEKKRRKKNIEDTSLPKL